MTTDAEENWSRAVADVPFADGAFGAGLRFASFRLDSRHTEQNQFASTVLYGTVTATATGGRAADHRVVVKLKHRLPVLRDLFKNDSQFHNEILFYERIAPLLTANCPANPSRTPSLCRYFGGRNDCGDRVLRDMVVLENACPRGYRSAATDHRLYLDLDHLTVALTALAKFHGLSYRAKHLDFVKFSQIVAEIKEVNWDSQGNWILQYNDLGKLMNAYIDRLTERQDGEEYERTRKFCTELLSNLDRTLRHMVEAVEPFAVLCHGDFNRNNLLFRYDDSGKPVDAMTFDMATVRYASPAVDLSFFLYMNTDRGTRDAHWDRLLDTYCAALTTAVSDVAGAVRVPDRAQLDAEMGEHGFHGIAHVSFFLRTMLEQEKQMDIMHFIDISDKNEAFEYLWSFGGDDATDAVVDVIRHFLNISDTVNMIIWSIEEELRKIANEGAFGKDRHLVSFKMSKSMHDLDEYTSKYTSITGTVITSDGLYYPVMIRLKIQDEMLRECWQSDKLFHNELIMYEKIIPFFLECRGSIISDANALSFPLFFYGRNKCGEFAEKDLLIFENVSTLGYRLNEDRLFLDNDHLTIALQTIAKFHGLSYTAKRKDPARFRRMVADIRDTQCDERGHWMSQNDWLKKFGKRAVDRLLARDGGHRYRDHGHLRLFNRAVADAANTLRRSLAAREPLSVLCHGMYCRNGVMFQYDERGRPYDALVVDFLMPMHGSPALDLSVLLCMNAARRPRWHDCLDTYCAALAAAVPPGVRVPDRAELDAEMAVSAIYGFARASFCVPYMLRDDSDVMLAAALASDDPLDYFLALGGDACTDRLADVVQHLVDMGYTGGSGVDEPLA